MKLRTIYIYLLLMTIGLSVNVSAGPRIFLPGEVHYHRFASYAPEVEAVWTNPAWLPASRNIFLQYIGEYEDGEITENKGLLIAGDRIGFSYRNLEYQTGENYKEYIFAGGMPLFRDFYIGGSYRYIKEGPGILHKRHFWNTGILINKYDNVKIAAVYSNLNRGEVNGVRSEIEQLYSVSYFTSGDKLILSTEITLAGSQKISDAKYRFGFEYKASERMRLFGMVDEDSFFQIGFRLNFGKYFSGLQSRFDSDNEHIGSSFYGGVSYTPPGR